MAFEVDYFVLEAVDATNMYVSLSGTPTDSSHVALDIIGGTSQLLWPTNGDFYVLGNRVKWDATQYGLYGSLGEADKLRVIYDR